MWVLLLDARYLPAQPEQSASYRLLGLLIAVTVAVAPWMLALMLVIHAPAIITLTISLVIAAVSTITLAAVMSNKEW